MKKNMYNLSLKLHSVKSFVGNVSTQEIEIIEKNNHNFLFIFPKTTCFTGNLNFDVLAHSRRYGGLKVKMSPANCLHIQQKSVHINGLPAEHFL